MIHEVYEGNDFWWKKKYRTRFSLKNQLIDYKKQVIITIITVNVNKYVN